MKTSLFRSLLYSLTAVVGLSLSSGAQEPEFKFGEISEADWQVGPPEDYPDANAVNLFYYSKYRIRKNDGFFSSGRGFKTKITVHVRKKIFTRDGVDEVGDVSIAFYSKKKPKNLKAQSYNPDGSVHTISKEEFYVKTVGSDRKVTFAFPSLDSGSIVEYAYSVEYGSVAPYVTYWLQHREYTLLSVFALDLPTSMIGSYTASNVPAEYRSPRVFAKYKSLRKPRTLVWLVPNLPPARPEPFATRIGDRVASVRYQLKPPDKKNYYKTWSSMGEFVSKFLKKKFKKSNKMKDVLKKINEESETPEEIVRKIYSFVVNEIDTRRDVPRLSFGRNNTAEVLKLGTGSAAEKNLLFLQLVRMADIEAWPMFIATRNYHEFNPEYKSLDQFNHIIAMVALESEGRYGVYIDANSKYRPYGLLGYNSRVDGGLLVDGKNSTLELIDSEIPMSRRTDSTVMYLGGDGSAVCSTVCLFTDNMAARFGQAFEFADPDDYMDSLFLADLDHPSELGNHDCHQNDESQFVVSFDFALPDIVDRLDDNLLMKAVYFDFQTNPFTANRRVFPIDFGFPVTYRSVTLLKLPDSLQVVSVPDSLEVSIPGISYVRATYQAGADMLISRTYVIEQSEFPSKRYAELKKFFQTTAEADQEEIILRANH